MNKLNSFELYKLHKKYEKYLVFIVISFLCLFAYIIALKSIISGYILLGLVFVIILLASLIERLKSLAYYNYSSNDEEY